MDALLALDEELSRPDARLIERLATVPGDVVILGAGGKMGPTLVRLLVRAAPGRRVTAVSRFSDARAQASIEAAGALTVAADLLDPDQVRGLPDAPNVIFMAGQKFGTTGQEARTWAVNALTPGLAAHRYRASRIVAFSTGNVYPLWPADSPGPTETDPVAPIGEYAQSALARERILTDASLRYGTPLAILRLNYATEPRYGVLRDIAERVRAGQPVDVRMGWVNVIWQPDANAAALAALGLATSPPLVLNLTGPRVAVRDIALAFGARWGVSPIFSGAEAPTALLSNAARAAALLGPPPTSLEEQIDRIARWIEAGGGGLGRPTHFEEREGRF